MAKLSIAAMEARLVITAVERQPGGGAGVWVKGRVAGHRFEGLAFPGHADQPEHGLGRSRLSKLWVQRLSDRAVVFSWDRGADVPAVDAAATAVVDFLAAGLADRAFAS